MEHEATPEQTTPTTVPARPNATPRKRASWLRRLLSPRDRQPLAPEAGARVGPYELIRPLNRGGMGEVWLAFHRRTQSPAAVKFLNVDARPGTRSWNTAARRLEREAAIMASLQSPHIAKIYSAGHWRDGTPYYVMELIDGTDLHTLVAQHGPQTADRVTYLLARLSEALADAHSRGVVHRDIKPANVMLHDDELKLIDFGVAHEGDGSLDLTDEGLMVGTPAFMPPESVLSADPPGTAADIYALGCVAYFLLSGKAPFAGNTPPEVLFRHVHEAPSPLPNSVPAKLARLIERCLDKQPDARPSAAELQVALASV